MGASGRLEHELLELLYVLVTVKCQTVTFSPIPAGTSRLLVIALNAFLYFGRLFFNDPALLIDYSSYMPLFVALVNVLNISSAGVENWLMPPSLVHFSAYRLHINHTTTTKIMLLYNMNATTLKLLVLCY